MLQQKSSLSRMMLLLLPVAQLRRSKGGIYPSGESDDLGRGRFLGEGGANAGMMSLVWYEVVWCLSGASGARFNSTLLSHGRGRRLVSTVVYVHSTSTYLTTEIARLPSFRGRPIRTWNRATHWFSLRARD